MVDTTAVVYGHIISSKTDLILGHHSAWSYMLLEIANSGQLKCCSVGRVLY
jgi:hypothetical protein